MTWDIEIELDPLSEVLGPDGQAAVRDALKHIEQARGLAATGNRTAVDAELESAVEALNLALGQA